MHPESKTTIHPMATAPRDGSFVHLYRTDGSMVRAQWIKASWCIWRDPEEFYWVNEDRKFAEVSFAKATGWTP